MAELPLDQGIPRFKGNEDRMNTFINGSETADMQTSSGVAVSSVRKLAKKVLDDTAALLATKNNEINVAANGILNASTAARDGAQTAAGQAQTSAGNAAASAQAAQAAANSLKIWKGTQAGYDGISVKDPDTLYLIV